MLKNELIKFFTISKTLCYLFIIFFITVATYIVVYLGKVSVQEAYIFFYSYLTNILIYIIPILIGIIISDIFTNDYASGNMKFFIIYKNRYKIFFAKIFAIFIITLFLVFNSFTILMIMYIFGNGGKLVPSFQLIMIIELYLTFSLSIIPLIFIYTLIAIMFNNSIIITLSIFLLLLAVDYFFRLYLDITPISILRKFISISNKLYVFPNDKFYICLLFAYLLVLIPINLYIFSKKEMLY